MKHQPHGYASRATDILPKKDDSATTTLYSIENKTGKKKRKWHPTSSKPTASSVKVATVKMTPSKPSAANVTACASLAINAPIPLGSPSGVHSTPNICTDEKDK